MKGLNTCRRHNRDEDTREKGIAGGLLRSDAVRKTYLGEKEEGRTRARATPMRRCDGPRGVARAGTPTLSHQLTHAGILLPPMLAVHELLSHAPLSSRRSAVPFPIETLPLTVLLCAPSSRTIPSCFATARG